MFASRVQTLNRIYAKGLTRARFEDKLTVQFSSTGTQILKLRATEDLARPSEVAAARIEAILAEREKLQNSGSSFGYRVLGNVGLTNPFGPTRYEDQTTEQLQRALATLEKDYEALDQYTVFEERAHKVNLEIVNHSDPYVEDATFELTMPDIPGFDVAPRTYSDPNDRWAIEVHRPGDPEYPLVTRSADHIVVTAEIGNLRHHRSTKVFGVDLRVVVQSWAVGNEIPIHCRLFGRNLPQPITAELKLVVQPSLAS